MNKNNSELLFLNEKVSTLEQKFNLILKLNQKLISELKTKDKIILELKKENTELKLKVEKLTVKSNEPSGSKPDYLKPSSNPKTWKSSGQKNGHVGLSRKNPKKIDKEEHYHTPDICPDCKSKNLKSIKIRTKIISDLKFEIIHIKEFLHDKKCTSCGAKIKAISPNGDSQSPYGKNLKTLLIYLRNKCGNTLRPLETLFSEFFGIKISDSSISNNEINLSKFAKLKYESYLDEIKNSKFSHKDETSYRVGGKTFWIWVYDSIKRVFYRLTDNRGKRTLITDFGENPKQISINDCYTSYNLFKLQQICWAHILRECEFHAKKDEATKDEKLFYKKIIKLFHLAKKSRLIKKSIIEKQKLRKEFESSLIEILISIKDKTDFLRRMCNRLDKNIINTFLFVEDLDIDPTNNLAERDLRAFVIHRKASFGSFSENGGQAKVIFKTIFENERRDGKLFSDALNFLFENFKSDLLMSKT